MMKPCFYSSSAGYFSKQVIAIIPTLPTRETRNPKPELKKLIFNPTATSSFLRVHRSFIISINQITSFTIEYIEINKKTIPISLSYRKEILQKLESF